MWHIVFIACLLPSLEGRYELDFIKAQIHAIYFNAAIRKQLEIFHMLRLLLPWKKKNSFMFTDIQLKAAISQGTKYVNGRDALSFPSFWYILGWTTQVRRVGSGLAYSIRARCEPASYKYQWWWGQAEREGGRNGPLQREDCVGEHAVILLWPCSSCLPSSLSLAGLLTLRSVCTLHRLLLDWDHMHLSLLCLRFGDRMK